LPCASPGQSGGSILFPRGLDGRRMCPLLWNRREHRLHPPSRRDFLFDEHWGCVPLVGTRPVFWGGGAFPIRASRATDFSRNDTEQPSVGAGFKPAPARCVEERTGESSGPEARVPRVCKNIAVRQYCHCERSVAILSLDVLSVRAAVCLSLPRLAGEGAPAGAGEGVHPSARTRRILPWPWALFPLEGWKK
jgi:hypothetical protein